MEAPHISSAPPQPPYKAPTSNSTKASHPSFHNDSNQQTWQVMSPKPSRSSMKTTSSEATTFLVQLFHFLEARNFKKANIFMGLELLFFIDSEPIAVLEFIYGNWLSRFIENLKANATPLENSWRRIKECRKMNHLASDYRFYI